MTQFQLFLLWSIASLGLSIALVLTRKRAKPPKPLPASETFVVMAIAVGGVLVFAQVLYKAYTLPELRRILEWDGMIALVVGAVFGVYLAIKEIVKLFQSS